MDSYNFQCFKCCFPGTSLLFHGQSRTQKISPVWHNWYNHWSLDKIHCRLTRQNYFSLHRPILYINLPNPSCYHANSSFSLLVRREWNKFCQFFVLLRSPYWDRSFVIHRTNISEKSWKYRRHWIWSESILSRYCHLQYGCLYSHHAL